MAPPQPGPEAVRFVAADASHRTRILLGSKLLIGVSSHVLAVSGRLGHRELLHSMERKWARAVSRLLRVRLDIEGVDHINPRDRYVVASLHEGLVDAIALIQLGLPLRFLVREELFEWPALGRYLRATGQIRVDENPSRSSLRALYGEVEAAAADGDSLAVFVQGSILGVEVAFRAGAFRIARRLGLPVLPVVITGSHRVWEHPFSPTVRLDQEISVRVLAPVESGQFDTRTVRDLERRMKRLALEPSTAPARRFEPDRDGWWDNYRYEIDPDYEDLARRFASRRAARPLT